MSSFIYTDKILVRSDGVDGVPLPEAKWLSCPFCGESDTIIKTRTWRGGDGRLYKAYWAWCFCCEGGGPSADTPNDARRLWNRRANIANAQTFGWGPDDVMPDSELVFEDEGPLPNLPGEGQTHINWKEEEGE